MEDRAIEHRIIEGVPVVEVSGDVDLRNVGDLRSALHEASVAADHAIIVSLCDASYFDSTTIHALLDFQAHLDGNQKKLFVVSPTRDGMRRIVSIVGMDRQVTMVESMADALARAKELPPDA